MPDTESVSVIIPTYNEAENIEGVLKRAFIILDKENIEYEVLVVDDASSDNTAEIAERILAGRGRVVRRFSDTRSLSLSVLDGVKQAKGDVVVVMDGDASHPPELISEFIKALREGHDLVIASRYVQGGQTQGFPLRRKIISGAACFMGRIITEVRDNTSGFFCIRKNALDKVELSTLGFKIGLEIFAKANFSSFKEIPYIFVNRKKGKSKLNIDICLQYIYQILRLLNYKMSKVKR